MLSKLKNLVGWGRKVSQDSAQEATVDVLGVERPVLMLKVYGLHSNAPSGSQVLLLSPDANVANMVGIETDINNVDTEESKEVAFGIPSEANRITAKVGGNFVFIGTGDFLARFNELKSGFDQLKADYNAHIAKYNAHVHTDPVSGNTGPPTVTDTTSSASIDAAKIDKLEVPS